MKIFDTMSAQIAYIMAVYRHRRKTVAALEKMVDEYAEERSSEMGEVGRGCRIVGAEVIELAPMLDTTGVSTATSCKVLRELLIAILKK